MAPANMAARKVFPPFTAAPDALLASPNPLPSRAPVAPVAACGDEKRGVVRPRRDQGARVKVLAQLRQVYVAKSFGSDEASLREPLPVLDPVAGVRLVRRERAAGVRTCGVVDLGVLGILSDKGVTRPLSRSLVGGYGIPPVWSTGDAPCTAGARKNEFDAVAGAGLSMSG